MQTELCMAAFVLKLAPKHPTGCKYMGYISYARQVMANFVLKFSHSTHAQTN